MRIPQAGVTDFWREGWPSLAVDPLSRKVSIELIEAVGGKVVADAYGEALAKAAEGLPMQLCPAAVALKHDREKGPLVSARVTLTEEQARSFRGVHDQLDADAQLFLHAVARLNPQRVVRDEILFHLKQGAEWGEARFDRAVGICEDLHLIDGTQELRMHQLFAGFVRETELPNDLANVRAVQAARLVEYAWRVDAKPTDAEAVSRLLAFPLDVGAWADTAVSGSDSHEVGSAIDETGRFREARPWYEHAVTQKEKCDVDGRIDHASLGSSLHEVGSCFYQTGQYDEARPWYERAVAEKEKGAYMGGGNAITQRYL